MSCSVGISGLGRIGRLLIRSICAGGSAEAEIKAVNSLTPRLR